MRIYTEQVFPKQLWKKWFYWILLASPSSKSWKKWKMTQNREKSTLFWNPQISVVNSKKRELDFRKFEKMKKCDFWDLRRTNATKERKKHVFSNVFGRFQLYPKIRLLEFKCVGVVRFFAINPLKCLHVFF